MPIRIFAFLILFPLIGLSLTIAPQGDRVVASADYRYIATQKKGSPDWHIKRKRTEEIPDWIIPNRDKLTLLATSGDRAVTVHRPHKTESRPFDYATICLEVWGPTGLINAFTYADLCARPSRFCDNILTRADTVEWLYTSTDHGQTFSIITWDKEPSEHIMFSFEDGIILKRQPIQQWADETKTKPSKHSQIESQKLAEQMNQETERQTRLRIFAKIYKIALKGPPAPEIRNLFLAEIRKHHSKAAHNVNGAPRLVP